MKKIHAILSDATHSVAILETSSSGGSYGIPVKLSTVRIPNERLEQLFDAKVLGTSKVEVIESYKLNASSTGPRSKYGQTLEALKDELKDHLSGPMMAECGSTIGNLAEMEAYQAPLAAKVRAEALDAKLPTVAELEAKLAAAEAENAQLRSDRDQLKNALQGVLGTAPEVSQETAPASRKPRL